MSPMFSKILYNLIKIIILKITDYNYKIKKKFEKVYKLSYFFGVLTSFFTFNKRTNYKYAN